MRRLLLITLLLAVGAFPQPTFPAQRQTELEGSPIGMKLKKGREEKPLPDPPEQTQLTTSIVTVEKQTINELLLKNHIYPDVEAFAIVYQLNPDLLSLDPLPPGTKLKLPGVQGGSGLQAAFAQSYLIALTADPDLKAKFDQSVRILNELITKLDGELFENPVAREKAISSLNKIGRTVEFIRLGFLRRNGRPLSRETLGQLYAETDLLYRKLNSAFVAHEKLDEQTLDLISATEMDLGIKEGAFIQVASGNAPPRETKVKVEVETVLPGNKGAIKGLRICYAPKALRSEAKEIREFRTLSTTQSELSQAFYVIWGIRDGDQERKPVTNELDVEVISSKEPIKKVQLTVIR